MRIVYIFDTNLSVMRGSLTSAWFSLPTLYSRPLFFVFFALALGLWGFSVGAQNTPLTLAVNEGVSYRNAEADTRERYQTVSADLSKLLKRPVTVVPVTDYKRLAADLAAARYDVAYVHPAHLSVAALRSGKYNLGALTKGFQDYRAHFIVPGNSALKTWQDYLQLPATTRTVIAPAEDSITSVLARATLNETLGGLPPITYTRYQDSVAFSLEHGLSAVGVTASPDVVKGWINKGGRVLAVSKPVPIKQLLIKSTLPENLKDEIGAYFLNLSSSDLGRKKLKILGVEGFVPFDEKVLMAIGKWLGQ